MKSTPQCNFEFHARGAVNKLASEGTADTALSPYTLPEQDNR